MPLPPVFLGYPPGYEGRKQSAGGGKAARKSIDPREIYGRVTVLPDRVEEAKTRLKAVHKDLSRDELRSITGQVGALARSVNAFEAKVEAAIKQADQQQALAALHDRHRSLEAKSQSIAKELDFLEAVIDQRKLLREDEEIAVILAMIV